MPYEQFGEKGRAAMARVYQYFFMSAKANKIPEEKLEPFTKEIGVTINAEKDAVFDISKKSLKLAPIIFQHGFTARAQENSGTCLELASHGHIVFSVNSMAGDSGYVERRDGTPVYFRADVKTFDFEVRREQLAIRVSDMLALVDQMHEEPNFLQKELGFPETVSLDLDKLAVSGHSFGGISAVLVASKEPRVKACLSMDPWFLPFDHTTVNFDNLKTCAVQ